LADAFVSAVWLYPMGCRLSSKMECNCSYSF